MGRSVVLKGGVGRDMNDCMLLVQARATGSLCVGGYGGGAYLVFPIARKALMGDVGLLRNQCQQPFQDFFGSDKR